MNMPRYFVFSYLFLCLETTLNNFRRCYGFFFESIISKVLDHSDVQSSLSIITKHLDNSIWKTPCNWRFYGHRWQDIELSIVCFFFSQTSLVFKFNLTLIEQFLPQFIYLSIFWYFILKFIQYLYAFIIRASKFLWASMLFFCEGLQLQNVIIFLFSMKH